MSTNGSTCRETYFKQCNLASFCECVREFELLQLHHDFIGFFGSHTRERPVSFHKRGFNVRFPAVTKVSDNQQVASQANSQ